MAEIITFPTNIVNPDRPIEYPLGRLLMLNLEKARRFQCRGFSVGGRLAHAIPGDESNLFLLRQAIDQGILIDVTDSPEMSNGLLSLTKVEESDTGLKVYVNTRAFFRNLGIHCEEDDPSEDDPRETVSYGTSDQSEQDAIDAAMKTIILVHAPGMDDPDKYLIKLN